MARKEKPTGAEIAEKAKGMKLDSKHACEGKRGDKKLKFTMADLSHLKTVADLEPGVVVGRLETGFDGDETSLKAGTYNMFLAKVGDRWESYAESDGQIKATAVRVRLEKSKPGEQPGTQPEFINEGWCIRIWLWWFLIPFDATICH